MENLVTLTVRSTNFYLIDCPGGRLLVDAGWAGSLPKFKAELRRYQIEMAEIRYIMMTHHHPDHAGLVEEVKSASGARLLIHEKQIPFLDDLLAFYRGKGDQSYQPIQIGPDDLILQTANRAALKAIGIPGEMVETPGHSDDSISFVTDSGMAFTGDLTLPGLATPENEKPIRESWKRLVARDPRMFYPAHGNPFSAAQIAQLLQAEEH